MSPVVGAILDRAAALRPRVVAATLDGHEVTFAEADHRATKTAHVLAGLGVRAGDRVAEWVDIALTSLDLFFGAARLGAAYAPLNPAFGVSEASDVLRYLDPRVLVVDHVHLEAGAALAAELGIELVVAGSPGGVVPGTDLEAALALASADAADLTPPDPATPHVIFLTSGSTGRPKGVMLSHYASYLRAAPPGGLSRMNACGGGGEVCMFPLFHMAGWNSLVGSWALLRPIHLVRRAEGDALLHDIEHFAASTLYCIPAVWTRVLEAAGSFDTSALRYALTGTSQVSLDLLHAIKDRFPGTETTVNYGSTEMGHAAGLGDWDLFRKPGSVGFPNPNIDVMIDGDGELCMRGDTVMNGYFRLPDETAEALAGGWYRTGDLAVMDDEGYLTITGRRREVIRSGGESVAPPEVEAAILSFPGVRDVAVVGLPDDAWGEVVCAVLVMEQGAPLAELDQLRAHLAGRLAGYKHPRLLASLPELPRTPATGQIQRRRVRDLIADGDGRLLTPPPPS